MRGQHIDAIVASRLVKINKKVTYIPGQVYTPYPYYNTFYGYYGAIIRWSIPPTICEWTRLRESKQIFILPRSPMGSSSGPEPATRLTLSHP